MATTVYLLRHGAYENPRQIYHGWLPGFHLSKEGKIQAQSLALKLKDKPLVAVYASHLSRARETAEIIAKPHNLTVTIDDRIIDVRSPLQGKTINYMMSVNWNQYRPEFIKAGGETLSEVYRRMHNFISEKIKQHQGEQFAVISHADPVMSVKVKLLGARLSVFNIRQKYDYVGVGRGFVINFDDNGWYSRISDI